MIATPPEHRPEFSGQPDSDSYLGSRKHWRPGMSSPGVHATILWQLPRELIAIVCLLTFCQRSYPSRSTLRLSAFVAIANIASLRWRSEVNHACIHLTSEPDGEEEVEQGGQKAQRLQKTIAQGPDANNVSFPTWRDNQDLTTVPLDCPANMRLESERRRKRFEHFLTTPYAYPLLCFGVAVFFIYWFIRWLLKIIEPIVVRVELFLYEAVAVGRTLWRSLLRRCHILDKGKYRAPQPQPRSRLLRLPQELQDRIWDHIIVAENEHLFWEHTGPWALSPPSMPGVKLMTSLAYLNEDKAFPVRRACRLTKIGFEGQRSWRKTFTNPAPYPRLSRCHQWASSQVFSHGQHVRILYNRFEAINGQILDMEARIYFMPTQDVGVWQPNTQGQYVRVRTSTRPSSFIFWFKETCPSLESTHVAMKVLLRRYILDMLEEHGSSMVNLDSFLHCLAIYIQARLQSRTTMRRETMSNDRHFGPSRWAFAHRFWHLCIGIARLRPVIRLTSVVVIK